MAKLRKTTKIEDDRSPGGDLNVGHLNYEAGILTTWLRL